MSFYNCHSHIFTVKQTPERFLYGFIPNKFVVNILNGFLQTRLGAKIVGLFSNVFVRKYARFIEIGTESSQDLIFERLSNAYPDGTRIVVLTMNMEYMGAGKSKSNFLGQLDGVIETRRRYPDTCLPFLGIDPRMGTAEEILDFVTEYIEKRRIFVGIKLYPSLGFFPFDKRLEKMYAFAAANHVPVLTHCTRYGIYNIEKPMPLVIRTPDSFNPSTNRKVNLAMIPENMPNECACDAFLDPENFYDVLDTFKDLKICFAHYGGEKEILKTETKCVNYSQNPGLMNWYEKINKLIGEYPNVYADVSYTLYDANARIVFKENLQNSTLKDKILFGTDYYMTEQEENPEKKLYETLRNELGQVDFMKIANSNTKKFLTSNFYTAP